jgi:hypothetical protein
MSTIKAVINYSKFADDSLATTAQAGHDGVAGATTTFATPTPAMATFQTHIDTYTAALAAVTASPGHEATLAKNAARDVVEEDLATLGKYVNLIANGDATIVALSGLPSYDTAASPPAAVRPAPTNLSVKHGTASGSVKLRFKQSVSGDPAEVQTCTSDPNVDANWSHFTTLPNSSGLLEGFTPGVLLWVRVRSIGPGGEKGAWSDPAQIRVL